MIMTMIKNFTSTHVLLLTTSATASTSAAVSTASSASSAVMFLKSVVVVETVVGVPVAVVRVVDVEVVAAAVEEVAGEGVVDSRSLLLWK